jgi:hypothetical protein
MRNYLILSLTLMIVGCSSSGPVPMGQNLYTISKTSPACGFRDAGGVKADLFEEINSFCQSKELFPEVVTLEALDGVIGLRCASATVEFRCVKTISNDIYKPSGNKPDRDMNRNPGIASNQGQFGSKPNEKVQVSYEINSVDSDDIYTKLKRLKELLDEDIITQREFEAQKEKILEK